MAKCQFKQYLAQFWSLASKSYDNFYCKNVIIIRDIHKIKVL